MRIEMLHLVLIANPIFPQIILAVILDGIFRGCSNSRPQLCRNMQYLQVVISLGVLCIMVAITAHVYTERESMVQYVSRSVDYKDALWVFHIKWRGGMLIAPIGILYMMVTGWKESKALEASECDAWIQYLEKFKVAFVLINGCFAAYITLYIIEYQNRNNVMLYLFWPD